MVSGLVTAAEVVSFPLQSRGSLAGYLDQPKETGERGVMGQWGVFSQYGRGKFVGVICRGFGGMAVAFGCLSD
jgi:hypothetical protein